MCWMPQNNYNFKEEFQNNDQKEDLMSDVSCPKDWSKQANIVGNSLIYGKIDKEIC